MITMCTREAIEGKATWFKTNKTSSMLLFVAPPEASSQTYTKFREFPTKV
ncbi:hypothetical protein [Sphingobacterium sp. FBM7-1]|nr:hypothetical protein [Sphingobacterium sp. FBM7-1]MCC2598207.1 hypothetical protein [Sphingobacterium sp. FBM7-1]